MAAWMSTWVNLRPNPIRLPPTTNILRTTPIPLLFPTYKLLGLDIC